MSPSCILGQGRRLKSDRWGWKTFGSLLGLALAARLVAQEVPPGFVVETLATQLNAATALAPLPDGRILLAEQTGRLWLWKEGGLSAEPALVIPVTDYWERGLIGLTLHPDFPNVPHVFVCYVTDRPFVHHVVSRFTMVGDHMERGSEKILLEGDDQESFGGFQKAGHQGGALRFGRDGCLYVSIGEQTAKTPSQDWQALQGSILRLRADGSIPEDNPFWEQTQGKYRSIFAKGVRNCFGLAAQPLEDGGRMFFTDVGDTRFEEINELLAGANYGWPWEEGPSSNPKFVAPLLAYEPSVGRSICGGMFYPAFPQFGAANFPEAWRGQFFFADWANHWIKSIDPNRPGKMATFGGGFSAPVALELDADGSLLVLNRGTIWRDGSKFVENAGSLMRIRYSPRLDPKLAGEDQAGVSTAALDLPDRFWDLPGRLSELSFFPWLQAQVLGRDPAAVELPARIRSYELNHPPWLPGLQVKRWWALPITDKSSGRMRFAESGSWELPVGAVLIHHFQSHHIPPRPIETRFIVTGRRSTYGVAYRWIDGAKDAVRVDDPEFAELEPGMIWPLAAPEPALTLPGASLSFAVDLTTAQLNRPGPDNPVRRWAEQGFLDGVPDEDALRRLPRLASLEESALPAEWRVRSYLDVHCAICHRPGGNSRGRFDARFQTSLGESGLILGQPEAGDLGDPEARLIVPGHPEKSILWRRLTGDELFRMPPVRYHSLVSPVASDVEAWIRGMK